MSWKLTINRQARATIMAATEAAHPFEACGLLLGAGTHIARAQPTSNVAADPLRHFEIDPVALIAAHRALRDGGPEILGYFHSHPNGQARPSVTDAAMAAHDGRVWLIVAGGAITCWCDGANGFEPLPSLIVQG